MKNATFFAFVVILSSCQNDQRIQSQYEVEKIRGEMKALILSYGKAVEEMDTARTLEHFSLHPEFLVYADGIRYTRAQVVKLVKNEFFRDLKSVIITWDTLDIQVIDVKNASCFALLNQTLVTTSGDTVKINVEATFIGNKNEKDWKIFYIHSRHNQK